MDKRIVLAGLLGGLALFAWESVAHMVLPLGEAGLKGLNNEPTVLAALKENIKDPGFYFFPAGDTLKPGMTGQQQQQAMENQAKLMRAGPAGILVIHPEGLDSLTPGQLLTQFGADVAVMILAALLLSHATALKTYMGRLIFVALIGLVPTLQTDLPQWNWFGFPGTYLLAQFTVHLAGFVAGGLVLAKLVKADR